MLKITFHTTIEDLDAEMDGATGAAAVEAYLATVQREILKEYPDATFEHNPISGAGPRWYLTSGNDIDHYQATDEIQEITERVWADGDFWPESTP